MIFRKYIFVLFLIALSFSADAATDGFLQADKRIKTFVFNENEVYSVVARNGFQTALEFAEDEKIDTISLGDPIGWKITNSGRRVFVKPMHTKGITNLSVFTDKRSYQFELVATKSGDSRGNHAYIVRFFYPNNNISADNSDRTRNSLRPVSDTAIPRIPLAPPMPIAQTSAPYIAPQAMQMPIVPIPPAIAPKQMQPIEAFNFNYTLTGPDSIAPIKIFDDGKSTYFEYPAGISNINFAIVGADGKEIPISASVQNRESGKMYIANSIAGKFSIRRNNELVFVYNENIRSLPSTDLATYPQRAGF